MSNLKEMASKVDDVNVVVFPVKKQREDFKALNRLASSAVWGVVSALVMVDMNPSDENEKVLEEARDRAFTMQSLVGSEVIAKYTTEAATNISPEMASADEVRMMDELGIEHEVEPERAEYFENLDRKWLEEETLKEINKGVEVENPWFEDKLREQVYKLGLMVEDIESKSASTIRFFVSLHKRAIRRITREKKVDTATAVGLFIDDLAEYVFDRHRAL